LCFVFVWLVFCFVLFYDTGAWTQGLYLKPLHQSYFCFSRQSLAELFAQAGFEPQSSWSLPPE
jgi:hypothetical protein